MTREVGFRIGWAVLVHLWVAAFCFVPAFAGPPFRTDDPEPVDFNHFEMMALTLGTKTDSGWDTFLPAYELNYGALPNLQLHTIIPVGFTAPDGRRDGFAMADVEVGFKFRFIMPSEEDWLPQVAIFPLIEIPVGNQKLGFSTGHAQYFLPLWLQKDFDPWTAYGGGGYWINPGLHNKNYVFFGAALWRKVGEQLNLGVELFHQTSSGEGIKESTGFNLGLTYDFTEHWHLLASAGTGVQNRSSTNEFSYYLALQLTF
jgi:hypothetical protein